jgi:hypothetical protein
MPDAPRRRPADVVPSQLDGRDIFSMPKSESKELVKAIEKYGCDGKPQDCHLELIKRFVEFEPLPLLGRWRPE